MTSKKLLRNSFLFGDKKNSENLFVERWYQSKALLEKYANELNDFCKYNKDTKDVFGFVNSWWVFGEVAKQLNYKIFMAEVENIGYKRTKRGEKPMPNELYRTNKKGEILVDDEVMKTVLDYMRKIEWD